MGWPALVQHSAGCPYQRSNSAFCEGQPSLAKRGSTPVADIVPTHCQRGHVDWEKKSWKQKMDWPIYQSFFWYDTNYRFVLCFLLPYTPKLGAISPHWIVEVYHQKKDFRGPTHQSFFYTLRNFCLGIYIWWNIKEKGANVCANAFTFSCYITFYHRMLRHCSWMSVSIYSKTEVSSQSVDMTETGILKDTFLQDAPNLKL